MTDLTRASELDAGDVLLDKQNPRGYVIVLGTKTDSSFGEPYKRVIFDDFSGWTFIPNGQYDDPMWQLDGTVKDRKPPIPSAEVTNLPHIIFDDPIVEKSPKSPAFADEVIELLRAIPDFQLYHSLRDTRFLEVTALRANDLDRMGEIYMRLERLAEIAWELKKG